MDAIHHDHPEHGILDSSKEQLRSGCIRTSQNTLTKKKMMHSMTSFYQARSAITCLLSVECFRYTCVHTNIIHERELTFVVVLLKVNQFFD